MRQPFHIGNEAITLAPSTAFFTDTVVDPTSWVVSVSNLLGGQFSSQDDASAPSIPITMSFASPTADRLIITSYGASQGTTIVTADANGNITSTEYQAGAVLGGMLITIGQTVEAGANTIYVIPGNAMINGVFRAANVVGSGIDTVVYTISTVSTIVAPLPIAPIVPSPVIPIVPLPISVDLLSIIQVSERSLARTYTKGTLAPITTETFTITNTSNDTTVAINIQSPSGVIFTPSSLMLPPGQVQPIVISFDTSIIDRLPEGSGIVNAIISLASTS
jgi:hypothetical protein